MNKASPVEIRKCLEMANSLAHAGIRFVPVPVTSDDEFNSLVYHSYGILDKIADDCDTTNQQFESLSNHKHHFINGTLCGARFLGDVPMKNHDATKFDQALLINKFYERYPLSEFKNDSERADALGYFMAGAELQRLGHFIEYNDKDDSDEY